MKIFKKRCFGLILIVIVVGLGWAVYQRVQELGEVERFDVGSSTALLVAQAQRDLLASQIAEVEAIGNYRIALVELSLAEGSLLEWRGAR
ncbi:MAG: TolC family protein [Rhodospirillales bacterium]|nr:TolC family protein [Rhodospirillales bacterium]